MNEGFQIAFGLLGGLAIFIYGMNMMSEYLPVSYTHLRAHET